MRTPVRTVEELEALDEGEIVEGYWDGREGWPEPGDNRGKAYWHGWRNGRFDAGYEQPDEDARALAHEFLAHQRKQRKSA